MRFLVLARPEDRLALEVHLVLERRHGRDAVRFATDDELLYGALWSHRIEGGRASTCIELADGTRIDSRESTAVLNRLEGVPADAFAGTPEPDRTYARIETHALWLSWLASLGRSVVGLASPRGLAAPSLGELEWLVRARRAGLPVRRYLLATNGRRLGRAATEGLELASAGARVAHGTPDGPMPVAGPALFNEPIEAAALSSALVVGDELVGGLPLAWKESALALARDLGCSLLEMRAAPVRGADARDARAWRFCGANAFPRACRAGWAAAIANELERRAAVGAPA